MKKNVLIMMSMFYLAMCGNGMFLFFKETGTTAELVISQIVGFLKLFYFTGDFSRFVITFIALLAAVIMFSPKLIGKVVFVIIYVALFPFYNVYNVQNNQTFMLSFIIEMVIMVCFFYTLRRKTQTENSK